MTSKTAATRYARALLDVALQERSDLDEIERHLAAFVDLFTAHPTLAKVLLNPAVPAPKKRLAMAEITARAKAPAAVSKLLLLLAERDRLALLPELLASFRDRLLDHRKIVRAVLTTAAPLAAEREQAIAQGLAQLTGRTVTLDTSVDPSIIGGVIARIGSTVYDGSVTRQLEKLKQKLVESV